MGPNSHDPPKYINSINGEEYEEKMWIFLLIDLYQAYNRCFKIFTAF